MCLVGRSDFAGENWPTFCEGRVFSPNLGESRLKMRNYPFALSSLHVGLFSFFLFSLSSFKRLVFFFLQTFFSYKLVFFFFLM